LKDEVQQTFEAGTLFAPRRLLKLAKPKGDAPTLGTGAKPMYPSFLDDLRKAGLPEK